jgi:hypothetical protein
MHGNVDKGLDDRLFFQTVVGFFLHSCSWGFLKRINIF